MPLTECELAQLTATFSRLRGLPYDTGRVNEPESGYLVRLEDILAILETYKEENKKVTR